MEEGSTRKELESVQEGRDLGVIITADLTPHFVKYIEVLERVQKAATNLVPKLRKFSYPDRLKKLGITSLEERRLRGDMIEVYNCRKRST